MSHVTYNMSHGTHNISRGVTHFMRDTTRIICDMTDWKSNVPITFRSLVSGCSRTHNTENASLQIEEKMGHKSHYTLDFQSVMSHVIRVVSRITWVTPHPMSHVKYSVSLVTHMKESRHTWMRHVTYMPNRSCSTVHGWVMLQIWMSHVTHRNQSCHTCERVTSHLNESWQLCIWSFSTEALFIWGGFG